MLNFSISDFSLQREHCLETTTFVYLWSVFTSRWFYPRYFPPSISMLPRALAGLGDTSIRGELWSCTASRVHPGHCRHLIKKKKINLLPAADSRQDLILRPESGNVEIHREPQALSLAQGKSGPHRRAEMANQVGPNHAPCRNRARGRRSQPRPLSSLHQTPRGSSAVSSFRLPQGAEEFRRAAPATLGTKLPAAPSPPFWPRRYGQPLPPPRPHAPIPRSPHSPSSPLRAQVTPPQTPTPPAAQRAGEPT